MDEQQEKPFELHLKADDEIDATQKTSEDASSDAQFHDSRPVDSFIGKTLSERYEILEKLGDGGMATVYKANHLLLNETKAIKILHSHLLRDENSRSRFKQEAKAQCNLRSEHLVSAVDFGVTEDNELFLVMDFADGENLSDILTRDGPFSWQEFLPLLEQICAGLSYAHEKGLVHRDIKPSNIMISKDSEDSDFARIVDFGIAKILSTEDGQNLTQTGEVFGSPPYMSPEQCDGRPGVDRRSDIYSLGCVIFESLTGVSPFRGLSQMETLMNQMTREPPLMSEVAPDLERPADLEKIVCKCLAKSKDDRYSSVDELQDDLSALKSGRPIAVSTQLVTRKKDEGKNTARYAIIAALLVGLLGGLSFYLFASSEGPSGQQSISSGLDRAEEYQLLASNLWTEGNLKKAEEYARKALAAKKAIMPNTVSEAAANNVLGRILLSYSFQSAVTDSNEKHLQEAQKYLQRAVELTRNEESTGSLSDGKLAYKIDLADYYLAANSSGYNRENLNQAEALLKQVTLEHQGESGGKKLRAKEMGESKLLKLWSAIYWMENRPYEAASIDIAFARPDSEWSNAFEFKDGKLTNGMPLKESRDFSGIWESDDKTSDRVVRFELFMQGDQIRGKETCTTNDARQKDSGTVTGKVASNGFGNLEIDSASNGKLKGHMIRLGDYVVWNLQVTETARPGSTIVPFNEILIKKNSD